MDGYERAPRQPLLASGLACLTGIVLALAVALAWQLYRHYARPLHDTEAAPRAVTARGELAADELAMIELFERTAPSVVHITTRARRLRRGYFSSTFEVEEGTGSGFVWSSDGYIVTNHHVIERAERCWVTLNDRTEWPGVVVGTDPDLDLAVLKIDAPRAKLPAILVGTSSDLRVGQRVFAIGNPFGLDQTFSAGVVSALNRVIQVGRPGTRDVVSITDVIQIDATINPGNSGGPLLDSAGRLIGINTAIASMTGASAGIGFAVPVDAVNASVPALIRGVERPVLGVSVLPGRSLDVDGLVVVDVKPGTPADRAGLRAVTRTASGDTELGDVILSIDGEPIREFADLQRTLARHSIGDEIELELLRDGARRRLRVKLES